jgi:hypothetical protein
MPVRDLRPHASWIGWSYAWPCTFRVLIGLGPGVADPPWLIATLYRRIDQLTWTRSIFRSRVRLPRSRSNRF